MLHRLHLNHTIAHVFYADASTVDHGWLHGFIDQDEHARLKAMPHPSKQKQSMSVRSLLACALRELYGDHCVAVWQLGRNCGRPVLTGAKPPFISLSHSNEWVACAISEVPVGLDIEHCKPRDYDALAKQICSVSEWRTFQSLPHEQRKFWFYRLWTAKEALFKLDGGELAREVCPDMNLQSDSCQDGLIRWFEIPGGVIGALSTFQEISSRETV